MLHIIWEIIKVILIILLSIVGILFIFVLLMLLCPFTYSISAQKKGDIFANLNIGWLAYLIIIKTEYVDENLSVTLKILGIPIRLGRKKRKDKTTQQEAFERENVEQESEEAEILIVLENDNSDIKIDDKDIGKAEKKVKADDADKKHVKPDDIKKNKKKKKDKSKNNEKNQQKSSIIHKLKLIIAQLKDERNKRILALLKKQILKVLKHIFPRKIQADIVFGAGDPAYTGEILALLSIIYTWSRGRITVTPDFENVIFEGSIKARGHIITGVLLIIMIRIVLNKDIRKLIAEYKSRRK